MTLATESRRLCVRTMIDQQTAAFSRAFSSSGKTVKRQISFHSITKFTCCMGGCLNCRWATSTDWHEMIQHLGFAPQ